MKYETILFSIEKNTAIIRLNRPDVYNSINRKMGLELIAVLKKTSKMDDVRAIIITGNGKGFCAGQDLLEALPTDKSNPDFAEIVQTIYNPIIKLLREIEKPIVAAVNGAAAGAGANIALAADIVVASSNAVFVQAFSKIGLIPDSGGTYFLPRLIGFQQASALMMLGDKVTAEKAKEIGMIYDVYPAEIFTEKSLQLANKLAAMPTKGLSYTKKLLNKTFSQTLEKQLADEQKYQILAGKTDDFIEGVSAFQQKREPIFKGK